MHFKQKLEKENNINKYEENLYYLIDKKWLQNWKAYVAYNTICNDRGRNNLKDKEIIDADENNILSIFKWNPFQNKISPLDNNEIYNNGEINPLSEFIIVDKNCYDFFVLPNNLPVERNKGFQLIVSKGKILLKFSPTQFLLSFKEKTKEQYWDLILALVENFTEQNLIKFLFS